ncbi:MAG: methylmalonyl-CoA epimerase, partial [Bacteroidota bacterium]
EKPKDGADNKRICFLHPKDTHGVLVELCQEK